MHFLITRQYQSDFERSTLDEDDVQALKFLAFLVSVAPPRAVFSAGLVVLLLAFTRMRLILRELHPRWLGAFFTNNVSTPMGYWYDIPASLLQNWELTHPIMAVEAFAVLTAIWQHGTPHWKRCHFWKDNEAAASAMIKGDSRLPVVGTMAMCVQLLLIRHNIAVWFEWVDSDSNLADGLSRDGAASWRPCNVVCPHQGPVTHS